LALRIPKPCAEDANVKEGTVVDVSVAQGKLVAMPLRSRKVTLKELLAKVTKANLHGEVDSGASTGRESW